MDQAKASAASDRLRNRFAHDVMPSGPPESLYFLPLAHRAIAITHEEERAAGASVETKLVARATRDNLQRLIKERTAMVHEPIIGTPEVSKLLRDAVAGQGLLPA